MTLCALHHRVSPRRRMLPVAAILFCVHLAAALCAAASSEAPLVLENTAVRVVIDPAVGRVMEFRPRDADARNILWVNSSAARSEEAAQAGYENWGGDKVWPAAQPFWRYALNRTWPPDTAVDGEGAAAAEQLGPLRARLVFPVSDSFHHQLEREFELDPTQPVLRIRNRITQLRASPFPAQVWSITQVPMPERVVFDVAPDAFPAFEQPVNLNGIRPRPPLEPQGFAEGSVVRLEGAVVFHPDPTRQQKLGTFGHWIAGVWSDGVLVQQVAFAAAGLYPEGTSLQLYQEQRYAELETLGVARLLAPGEVLETIVTWRWLPPVDSSLTDAALSRELAQSLSAAPSSPTVDQPKPEDF